MTAFSGACLCGAVRFHVDAPPKWIAYCHCSMCRRAHGAGTVAWVGVTRASFHVDTPPPAVAASASNDGGALVRYASSAEAHRSFCSRCGTSLFFESERWGDEVHIALGVVNEPHTLAPTAHAFFDDRASWVHVDDGLPRRGGANGTTPL